MTNGEKTTIRFATPFDESWGTYYKVKFTSYFPNVAEAYRSDALVQSPIPGGGTLFIRINGRAGCIPSTPATPSFGRLVVLVRVVSAQRSARRSFLVGRPAATAHGDEGCAPGDAQACDRRRPCAPAVGHACSAVS